MKSLTNFLLKARSNRDFFELVVKIDLAISAIFPFVIVLGGTSLITDDPTARKAAIVISASLAALFVASTFALAHTLREQFYGYKETKTQIKKGK